MIGHSLTLNERKYIRSRVRKKVNDNIKRKIAQRLVENAYQKHSMENFLSSLPKKDLRGIIETYDTHKELINLGVRIVERNMQKGVFTNSKAKVNEILREHKVVNKKGLLKESWAEFGLDMLFGFGPAIASAVALVPGLQVAAGVGVGLGIAGMIYYGYKFSSDASIKNTMGMVINGISFIFSAAEVFPMVGSAVGFVGKQIGKVLGFVFSPLIKLAKFAGGAVMTRIGGAIAKAEGAAIMRGLASGETVLAGEALASAKTFLSKEGFIVAERSAADITTAMGKIAAGKEVEVLSKATTEMLEETAEQAGKHIDKMKSLNKILEKGKGLMDKALDLLKKLVNSDFVSKIPIGNKLVSPINKVIETITKETAFILERSAAVSLAAETAALGRAGELTAGRLTEIEAGALINIAANAEKAEAQRIFEIAARESAALREAAKDLPAAAEIVARLEATSATQAEKLAGSFSADIVQAEMKAATEAAIAELKALGTKVGREMGEALEGKLASNLEDIVSGILPAGTKGVNPTKIAAELEQIYAAQALKSSDAAFGIIGSSADDIVRELADEGVKIYGDKILGATVDETGELILRMEAKTPGTADYTKRLSDLLATQRSGATGAANPQAQEFLTKFAQKSAEKVEAELGEKLVANTAAGKKALEKFTMFNRREMPEVVEGITTHMGAFQGKFQENAVKYLKMGDANSINMLAVLMGKDPKLFSKFAQNALGTVPKTMSMGASSDRADIARAGVSTVSLDPEKRAEQVRSMYGQYDINESLRRKSLRYLY